MIVETALAIREVIGISWVATRDSRAPIQLIENSGYSIRIREPQFSYEKVPQIKTFRSALRADFHLKTY